MTNKCGGYNKLMLINWRRFAQSAGAVFGVNACEKEIKDIHVVIEQWLAGTCTNTNESFSNFSNRLSKEFVIISPRGVLTTYDELCSNMKTAHGSTSDLKIWIEDVQLRHETNDTIIVTYQEWQQRGNDETTKTARLSTVTFKKLGNDNIEWLHLHETWLPGNQPVKNN